MGSYTPAFAAAARLCYATTIYESRLIRTAAVMMVKTPYIRRRRASHAFGI
jgi:hypothetical protein